MEEESGPAVTELKVPISLRDLNRSHAAQTVLPTRTSTPGTIIEPPEPTIFGLSELNLWYGNKHAISDIAMKLPVNKVTALIGPSGCGKSTLLRCLNRMNDLITGVR